MNLRFARVPGGRFDMGSASGRDDERPVRRVTVAAFSLGLTPVTNAEYAAFVAAGAAEAPPWSCHAAFRAPDQPVVGVTWHEAAAFGDWLTASEGVRCRLPTEAEWEFAARGNPPGAPPEVPGGAIEGPWPVARGNANAYGLFDLGTIVHEWCLDWYAPNAYESAPADNPRGPDEGVRRASRGGSWRHHVRFSPPSARSSLLPHLRYADYGFRVLKEES